MIEPEGEVCAKRADECAGEDVDSVVVEVEPAGDADEDCRAEGEVDGDEEKVDGWCGCAVSRGWGGELLVWSFVSCGA